MPRPRSAMRKIREVLRLGRRYGDERLEAAATRALAIRALSYRSLESILKRGLDLSPLPDATRARPTRRHANLRGATYYE